MIIQGKAKTTIQTYLIEAEQLLYFSPVELLNIDLCYEYLKHKKISNNATFNSICSSLNKFLKTMYQEGYHNCKFALPHRKINRKLPNIYNQSTMMFKLSLIKRDAYNGTQSNCDKVLDWKNIRDYVLIAFAYATGLRNFELMNLQASAIRSGWVNVRNGKGNKERYVPYAESIEQSLNDYRELCPYPTYKHFFVNDKGKKISCIQLIKIFTEKLGLTPHAVRHMFASHLIQNGCDLAVVQEFLGHESLITTQIYTHLEPSHLQQTVEQCHPCSQEPRGSEAQTATESVAVGV